MEFGKILSKVEKGAKDKIDSSNNNVRPMNKRSVITTILLLMLFACASVAQAQETIIEEENDLSKIMAMVSNLTDEQKEFVRTHLLEAPQAYTRKHDHPATYLIQPNPAPDTQPDNECAGCSSAYLLRFYGVDVDGVSLYHKDSFPCKHDGGAFPKCFKELFEDLYEGYTTEYYTGTTEDLKDAVSQGIPVIVLLFKGKTLHYVPVVGYDESHFFIQDSSEKYRNVTDNDAYNEAIDIETFDKTWNIPLESCQRLFVIVKKTQNSDSEE